MNIKKELTKGSSALLVLSVLENEEMYGYQIIKEIEKRSGKMIGTIELYNHSPLFKAELGYSLNPKYWGLGIVPEATNEIVSYGFEFLSLKRIEVGIFVDNIQSKRVCEKTGFSFEGVSRNGYIRYDGIIFDKANYAMTKEDYFNRKYSR